MAQADYSITPFGSGGIPANENSGTAFAAPRWYYGTAAPTTAAAPAAGYNLGDIVYNVNQSVGAPLAWVCTTGGTSFVFSSVGGSSGGTIVSTVTATTGTLAPGTIGSAIILLNPATTGTYSLPEASSQTTGTRLTIKNIAVGPVTLTPLGTDQYEGGNAAAITLVQDQGIELFASGTTNWYNETSASPPVLLTTATSGTLSNYQSLILLNPATTGTYSLPEAGNVYAGFQTTIKNIAGAGSLVTLTPLGTDQYEGGTVAAITLSSQQAVMLKANSTNWYDVTYPQYQVSTQPTATPGTLTNGQRLVFLTGTGTYSMPEAKANFAGFTMTVYNKGGTNTLAPLASDQYNGGVAAVTLTNAQSATLITDATTNWYHI